VGGWGKKKDPDILKEPNKEGENDHKGGLKSFHGKKAKALTEPGPEQEKKSAKGIPSLSRNICRSLGQRGRREEENEERAR